MQAKKRRAVADLAPSVEVLQGRVQVAGAAVLMAKQMKLSGDRLLWSEASEVTEVETEGLLTAFLNLAARQPGDDNILEFARRFGPLRLCARHALVAYHRPIPLMDGMLNPAVATVEEMTGFDMLSLFCAPTVEREKPRLFSEPVERWRRLAGQARDLLAIAADLRRLERKAATPIDAGVAISRWYEAIAPRWQRLDGLDLKNPAYTRGWWPSDPWTRLAEDLNRWLRLSDVEIFVVPQAARGLRLQLRLSSNRFTWSVLSLVALELVSAVIGAEGIGTCSNCGLPYPLGKPPVEGKRSYCPKCRSEGVPQRDATRGWRQRKGVATSKRHEIK